MPTKEEIEAVRSPRGGWTKNQLAEWGVPWPPPKGWKRALESEAVRADPLTIEVTEKLHRMFTRDERSDLLALLDDFGRST